MLHNATAAVSGFYPELEYVRMCVWVFVTPKSVGVYTLFREAAVQRSIGGVSLAL